MKSSEVDRLKEMAGQIRNEGEGLVRLADAIETGIPMLVTVAETSGKGHLSAAGLQKATEAARAAWIPCPKGCRKRDGVTVKKHRADHAHIRRAAKVTEMPGRRHAAAA